MPEINFFWDPLSDNILQERDETGAVTAEYTAEPGLYGNIISQNRGGVESQFHYDAQGSTLAVTDDNQNVTDTFAYTAFGEVTERTGATEVPFQYIGQKGYYRDIPTGEYLVRRRPYDPVSARWNGADPLQLWHSFRLGTTSAPYAYARNTPSVLDDPSGLLPRLAITLGSIDCSGCSGFKAEWLINIPAPNYALRLLVIQHIQFATYRYYCDPKVTCAGVECVYPDPLRIESCAIGRYEYLGDIVYGGLRLPSGREIFYTQDRTADTWIGRGSPPDDTCRYNQATFIQADVRAFLYDATLDPASPNAMDGWGSEGTHSCGLHMSPTLNTRPSWWNQHLYESHSKLAFVSDCCSKPFTSSVSVRTDGAPPVKIADCIRRPDIIS